MAAPSLVKAPLIRRWAKAALAHRRMMVVGVHVALWALSYLAAFALRFDFNAAQVASLVSGGWLLLWLGVRTLFAALFDAFAGLWRYTGARDVARLGAAATCGTVTLAALATLWGATIPRSIFVIDWLGCLFTVGGLRLSCRLLLEMSTQLPRPGERRTLIVGAGHAGEMLLRELRKGHGLPYVAVGLVDDDRRKHGARLHGVRVLGGIEEVAALAARHGIDAIVIAVPSARGRAMRRIVRLCQSAGVPVRTLPSLAEAMGDADGAPRLRKVAIEDLLGRSPIALDTTAVQALIAQRSVLVTGAGGSIGAELCRQVAQLKPSKLVLVDQAENALFTLESELARDFAGVTVYGHVASVRDARRMAGVLRRHAPSVILHAAAHKHVPLMERNPGEAIANNVAGTRILAELAHAHGVQNFVMISTDKAVNPTSVMGATKRVAELIVQSIAGISRTRFGVVRFGNVLGSQGSVVPIFSEQIARGGPVTITHPEMRRYFMTIPEACQLVLQAGAGAQGGELFILDMGEPVKIVDLARDLIRLSGLVPDEDIEITYVGVRRGEKLFEELSLGDERADKTRHPQIYVGRSCAPPWRVVRPLAEALEGLACSTDDAASLRGALMRVVPEYRPAEASAAPPAGWGTTRRSEGVLRPSA